MQPEKLLIACGTLSWMHQNLIFDYFNRKVLQNKKVIFTKSKGNTKRNQLKTKTSIKVRK